MNKSKIFRVKRIHLNLFYLFTFAVMLLVTPLIIIQNQQPTQLKSKAAGASCNAGPNAVPGTCLDTAECTSKKGGSYPGYCPGEPANIQCCITEYTACTSKGGKCQSGATDGGACTPPSAPADSGHYQTNLCLPNPDTSFLCCVPGAAPPGNPPPGNPPPANPPPANPPPGGPDPDQACADFGGTCKDNCAPATDCFPGKCGGNAARQCYKPGNTQPPPAGSDTGCTHPQVGGECQDNATSGGTCHAKGYYGTYQSGKCGSKPSASYLCCVPDFSKPVPHTPACADQKSESACNAPPIPLQCHWTGGSCAGGPATNPPPNPLSPVSINMTVALQGVGQGAGANPNPQNQTVQASVKIQTNNGGNIKTVTSASDSLTYDSATGNYINSKFNLGTVAAGDYQMTMQIDKYLDKQMATKNGTNTFVLGSATTVEAATVEMRAGDVAPTPHGDNYVNIIDYNAVIGCMPGTAASACLNKKFADLNDDGTVDQKDLDILQSNFGQSGYSFQTAEFKCESDPTCTGGKNSLQLCSLLCTRKSQRS